jgi:hypothetical protein
MISLKKLKNNGRSLIHEGALVKNTIQVYFFYIASRTLDPGVLHD